MTNGTGTDARFRYPVGIASDAIGTLYVGDSSNDMVRKISPAGMVTTLAGSATGITGSTDGVGSEAKFNSPFDIKLDASGNLYVADSENYSVRKISPAGMVSTVVGAVGGASFAAGVLPGVIGDYSNSLAIYGGQLFIGTNTRVLKVNGLP